MPPGPYPPDHDLLIRIETKLDVFTADMAAVKGRLTEVERALDRQAGFISGGKALWAIIGALPPGVAALILGLRA